jgi:hypothetical protein
MIGQASMHDSRRFGFTKKNHQKFGRIMFGVASLIWVLCA